MLELVCVTVQPFNSQNLEYSTAELSSTVPSLNTAYSVWVSQLYSFSLYLEETTQTLSSVHSLNSWQEERDHCYCLPTLHSD